MPALMRCKGKETDMKKGRIFIVAAGLFAAGALMPAISTEAYANSAPPYWEGTDGSGIVVSGGQCPVEVEHERLTFRVPQLPTFMEQDDLKNYRSEVTAKYTFYNPTDLDVKMKLLFPFGCAPSYIYSDEEDFTRYTITADGAPVEYTLRHTFCRTAAYGGSSFDVDEEMGQLFDGFREDGFFAPNMPVREYRYTVNSTEERPDLKILFEFNPQKTKIIGSSVSYSNIENGRLALTLRHDSVYGGSGGVYDFSFAAAGENPVIYSAEAVRGGEKLGGAEVSQGKRAETTFRNYILARRGADSAVSESDWYNAALDYMEYYRSSSRRRGEDFYALTPYLTPYDFTRWYEYELTVSAGGRAVNEVTAPLYPTIDGRGNSDYRYTYYLSPARKWADFRGIDVAVETPYNLTDSSLDFTKGEGVYTFSRGSLPMGELTFTLYEGNRNSSYGGGLSEELISALVIAGVIVVLCAAVAIVFGVRHFRRGRKRGGGEEKK